MTNQELWMILPIVFVGISVLATILVEVTANNFNKTLYTSLFFLVLALLSSLNIWFEWTFVSSSEYLFGDTRSVDKFAVFFYFLIIFVTIFTFIVSRDYLLRIKHDRGELLILILLSLTGMMVLVSARELITIYVALELSSLPLIALGAIRRGKYSAEIGLKFFVLSSVSTAILIYGFVFLYGLVGSTHLSQIAIELKNTNIAEPALLFSIVAIIAGFGFKMALVPWQSWIPDFYQGAPIPVTAFLSVASKASAFAIVIRIFVITLDNSISVEFWVTVFSVVSVLSMSIGNFIALSQSNFLRLLGFSTIAQAGYMLIGIAAFTSNGLGVNGLLYYLAGYGFSNLTVFFVFLLINSKFDDDRIDNLNGLIHNSPFLAIFIILGLLSLLGMPPTVGFMGKLFVFSAAIDSGLIWLAIIGGINTVVGAYYYLRIIKKIIFDNSNSSENIPVNKTLYVTYSIGALGIIFLGVLPALLLNLTKSAIESLI